MKKKTVSEPEKTWRRGPEKEKVQITVRIQKELMDQATQVMKATNMRITDMLEEGLVLAMKSYDQELSLLATQVRFQVANATKGEQEQLRDFLAFLKADELRPPTEVDLAIRRFIRDYLKTFVPLRNDAAHLYSRYGRTEAEIEKLTG